MEQIVYCKMLEQEEEQEKKRLKREQLGYKLAKGHDYGSHNIISAISYSEYHTNKINGQRPFDRPFGNSDRDRNRNKTTGDWTYSKNTTDNWTKAGDEVYKYNRKGILIEVVNPTKETKKKFAGIRIKYSYTK